MQCSNILYIFFPRLSRQILKFFVKLTHKYALVNEILTRQAFFYCIIRILHSQKLGVTENPKNKKSVAKNSVLATSSYQIKASFL